MTTICIVAGESSGDKQAARLVHALQNFSQSQISFWGVAGSDMRAAGVEPFLKSEDLAVMGLVEVLGSYLQISSYYKTLLRELQTRKPDILIVVDYPGFNMRLIQDAFALGIKVFYHIPPKVWAHGFSRIHTLANSTHLVTCVLPFEEHELRKNGVVAKFVGNPLFDSCHNYRSRHPLQPRSLSQSSEILVGLCPGSRESEVAFVLKPILGAFEKLTEDFENVKGLLPVANTLDLNKLQKNIRSLCSEKVYSKIQLTQDSFVDAVGRCDYAWVCSGTATLETAFLKVPHSIVYRMNGLSYWVAKKIVNIPYIGLANWCAGKKIVDEFLQDDCTPENLVNHAKKMLFDNESRQHFWGELSRMERVFPHDAEKMTAKTILRALDHYDSASHEMSLRIRDYLKQEQSHVI